MGFIIVTSRNILWLLLSLTAVMALVAGVITPRWLVGYEHFPDQNSTKDAYSPTIGLYNRCLRRSLRGSRPWSCYRYIDGLGDMPSDFWKASFVFIVAGSAIAGICVLLALVGFCVQNIGKKSLYSVVGVVQAIAGLLLIIGLVLYPAGWGEENDIVRINCFPEKIKDDNKPSAFKLGGCSIGWAFYSALGGTVLLFLCAVLSSQAEKSTSSDRVQDEIYKGKTVICLP